MRKILRHSHHLNYTKTALQTTYELTGRGDIDNHFKSRGRINQETLDEPEKNALINDEIHLRVAHYSDDGFVGSYTVQRVACCRCYTLLPNVASFLHLHYYCVPCVVRIAMRHCITRMTLLRQTGILPNELCTSIGLQMLTLCFDWDTEFIHKEKGCQCFLYVCDSVENKRIINRQHCLLIHWFRPREGYTC